MVEVYLIFYPIKEVSNSELFPLKGDG